MSGYALIKIFTHWRDSKASNHLGFNVSICWDSSNGPDLNDQNLDYIKKKIIDKMLKYNNDNFDQNQDLQHQESNAVNNKWEKLDIFVVLSHLRNLCFIHKQCLKRNIQPNQTNSHEFIDNKLESLHSFSFVNGIDFVALFQQLTENTDSQIPQTPFTISKLTHVTFPNLLSKKSNDIESALDICCRYSDACLNEICFQLFNLDFSRKISELDTINTFAYVKFVSEEAIRNIKSLMFSQHNTKKQEIKETIFFRTLWQSDEKDQIFLKKCNSTPLLKERILFLLQNPSIIDEPLWLFSLKSLQTYVLTTAHSKRIQVNSLVEEIESKISSYSIEFKSEPKNKERKLMMLDLTQQIQLKNQQQQPQQKQPQQQLQQKQEEEIDRIQIEQKQSEVEFEMENMNDDESNQTKILKKNSIFQSNRSQIQLHSQNVPLRQKKERIKLGFIDAWKTSDEDIHLIDQLNEELKEYADISGRATFNWQKAIKKQKMDQILKRQKKRKIERKPIQTVLE